MAGRMETGLTGVEERVDPVNFGERSGAGTFVPPPDLSPKSTAVVSSISPPLSLTVSLLPSCRRSRSRCRLHPATVSLAVSPRHRLSPPSPLGLPISSRGAHPAVSSPPAVSPAVSLAPALTLLPPLPSPLPLRRQCLARCPSLSSPVSLAALSLVPRLPLRRGSCLRVPLPSPSSHRLPCPLVFVPPPLSPSHLPRLLIPLISLVPPPPSSRRLPRPIASLVPPSPSTVALAPTVSPSPISHLPRPDRVARLPHPVSCLPCPSALARHPSPVSHLSRPSLVSLSPGALSLISPARWPSSSRNCLPRFSHVPLAPMPSPSPFSP
ncbi:hypothetical protein LXA43DRAFT_1091015 [Ganoderma leucocontextum]|nr:hypothetical protein LXA43DRAFT_1091015 [Ganoderma leucocontextum]